jgi:hypothetical protein
MHTILGEENAAKRAPGETVLRSARGRRDDYFFAGMSLAIFSTVLLGFAHTYFLAGMFHARLPSAIVHIHAMIFSTWILLLPMQVALVSIGRVSWHKRLGIFGAVLACLMVVLGVLVTIDSTRRRFAPPGLDSATFLANDLMEMLVFALLVAWGLRARRDGDAHKRLIVLATVALLGAAVSRWHFYFPVILRFPFLVGLIVDAFLVSLALFDLFTRRRIHRVTLWGSLMVLLIFPVAFGFLGHAPFWHRFTEWVQRDGLTFTIPGNVPGMAIECKSGKAIESRRTQLNVSPFGLRPTH